MPEHHMRTSLILALVTPAVQSPVEFTDDQAILIVRNADRMARAMIALGATFSDETRKGAH